MIQSRRRGILNGVRSGVFMLRFLIISLVLWFGACMSAFASWHEVTTRNFTVRGDASRATLEEFALELEQYRVFLGILVGGRVPPPEPVNVPVYVMASSGSFGKIFDNPQANGVFTSRIDSPIFIGNARRVDDGGYVRGQKDDTGRLARLTLKHEYVHHFTHIYGPAYYPIWYSEGAADYYSSFEYKDGIATVGQLLSVRGSWLVNDSLLPWKDVFNSMRYWTRTSSDSVSKMYAQSWLATHYMFNDPDKRKQLARYLQTIAMGTDDPEAAFEDAFGMGTTEMGRLVRAYLRSNQFPVQRYDLSKFEIETDYQTRELPEWEEQYALGYAQRFFARDDEAVREVIATFGKALAGNPDHVPSLIELAFIYRKQGDEGRFQSTMSRLDELAPDHPSVLVLKGLSASRVEGRALFDRARQQDPRNVLAHYHFAASFQPGEATEEALDAALEAMTRSANRTDVPLLVGRLLVELGYGQDAENILRPIVAWASEAADRERARALLSQL